MKLKPPVQIITRNEKMQKLVEKIDKVSGSDSSILLVGETGVGKEIFAEYVHYSSPRAEKPFVKISLSALPPDLLESELFGHEKGSFTSAHQEKAGLFEIANTGSIFLDDIDDVPMEIQTKLLRVLEQKELLRVGGTKPIPIDVRLITASKIDLKVMINRGMFRADLFYRINVVPINIPPLRDRMNDVPALTEHFFNHYAPDKNLRLSDQAAFALKHYSWPGNVRELKNVIQRVSLFAENVVKVTDLPPEIRSEDPLDVMVKACDRCFTQESMTYDEVVQCLERNLLRQALQKAECNKSEAARMLNMSLSTFRDKLKKFDLDCSNIHTEN